jgi:4,5-DOPA dioxygenase extradiol
MSQTMPVIFFGHGNPLNALEDNKYTQGWHALGQTLPAPKGILSISAHWYVPFTAVTTDRQPRTIHDFGGFPRELYQVQYPAQGSPELAARVQKILDSVTVKSDSDWGLDHGTWSVLVHLFPDADIPVIQLSIDFSKSAEFHYQLGKKLAPLREEDILILGSGNIVHNLHAYAWGRKDVRPFDWAERFEDRVRDALLSGDDQSLVNYRQMGNDAQMAIPTPDHYLPLLYILGARRQNEPLHFPVEGLEGGSVSMLAVRFG